MSVDSTASPFPSPPLPAEIILQIVSYLTWPTRLFHTRSDAQKALHAVCLVARSWYQAAVPALYHMPVIRAKNFDEFVATICPSINAHVIRSPPADFVRVLDLSKLVHSSSKSLNARLLGRVKERLETFVAPQATFGINSFAPLSKCHSLVRLDLSLTSEALDRRTLFRTLGHLENLTIFYVPRLYTQSRMKASDVFWPPKLREVYVHGQSKDVDREALELLPPSLRCLSFRDCRQLSIFDVDAILIAIGKNLRGFVLGPGLVTMTKTPLGIDNLLDLIPHVTHLTLYVEYTSLAFFRLAGQWRSEANEPHPLRHLVVGSESDDRYDDLMFTGEFCPEGGYVYGAMVAGGLSNLRIVTAAGALTAEHLGGLWDSPQLSSLLEKLDDEKGGFEDAYWDPEVKEGPWDESRWHRRDT